MTPFRVVQPTKEFDRLVPEAACGQAFPRRFEPLMVRLSPGKFSCFSAGAQPRRLVAGQRF
jgi:hypothetical protein